MNPCIERKTQVILVAILLKNSAVRADWRDAEAFLNIFPVDNLVLLLSNDDHILQFSVPDDWSKARLYAICLKRSSLLWVAIGQTVIDDLTDTLNARGFPFHGNRSDRSDFYANKNSLVLNSLIVSLSFAAFSNSNRFAASRMSLSSLMTYASNSGCDLNSGMPSASPPVRSV